jgi:uncharacterized membrane protein
MFVVFPLGLFATSVAWDIVFLATGHAMWAAISFWTIIAGLVGSALAAITGLVDFVAIPRGTRAKRIGVYHGLMNVLIVVLFLVSAIGRVRSGPRVDLMILGWIGVALALVSGWLGGELVERLGVGVDDNADVNAPSSI